jgi:hypothetical protein
MKKSLIALLVSSSLLLAACVTTGTSSSSDTPVRHSGFLSDYSKLRPVEGKEGVMRHIDGSANLRAYNKLYIDPVQIVVTPDGPYKGVQPEAQKRITDSFYKAFADSVTPAYKIVSAPGPDVMRVRLAISGVQPVSPALEASDFIPIKAVYNVGRAVAGEAPRLAELTGEIEVLDGQNRVVIAAVATRKSDQTLPQGERITWSELSPIVFTWARQFRLGIDELRGVPTTR